jgi:hypothetical protein
MVQAMEGVVPRPEEGKVDAPCLGRRCPENLDRAWKRQCRRGCLVLSAVARRVAHPNRWRPRRSVRLRLGSRC